MTFFAYEVHFRDKIATVWPASVNTRNFLRLKPGASQNLPQWTSLPSSTMNEKIHYIVQPSQSKDTMTSILKDEKEKCQELTPKDLKKLQKLRVEEDTVTRIKNQSEVRFKGLQHSVQLDGAVRSTVTPPETKFIVKPTTSDLKSVIKMGTTLR